MRGILQNTASWQSGEHKTTAGSISDQMDIHGSWQSMKLDLRFILLLLCFFLSVFAALLYEAAWAQIGIATLSLIALANRLPELVQELGAGRAGSLTVNGLVAALGLFPSALCVGATFPIAVRLCQSTRPGQQRADCEHHENYSSREYRPF